ncbi:MAG: RNA polymerase factor sigma-54 [bacterium]
MPNMNTNLNISQQQKLSISPQLQHAIKLLQMNSIELMDKIENELAENPFLDLLEEREKKVSEKKKDKEEDRVKPLETEHERKIKSDEKDEYIESYFADSSDIGYSKDYKSNNSSSNYSNDNTNSKQSFLEGAISENTTFYEELISQLRFMNINDKEFLIGEAIISSLDEDGYFRTPMSDIAESLNVSTEEVNKVLSIVQKLDPAGVAARDLQECLLIQIDRQEEKHPIAKEIVIKFLDNLLQQHRYKEITAKLKSAKFNVTLKEVEEEVNFISNLEPYPARNYETTKVKFIIPDVSVRKIDDTFNIIINDEYIPKVGINKYYKKLLSKDKEKVNEKAKEYLNNKYSEAKLLVSSIKKRHSTISQVVEKIVEHQIEFFEKGPQYLKPLTLKVIAEKVNMHESTISRVTTDKYMDTPWGIVPFKYFFSSGIKGKSVKSSTSIKELIKEIIDNEKDKKALTDNKIVEILSNRGIKIARRTVAKYRKSLKIMPSYYRKK